jgi:hypothetical protein
MDIPMTHHDELTRLRVAMELVLKASDITEAHLIADEALVPLPTPKTPRQYEEAQSLADLDPHAWRIVGRQVEGRPRYTIPADEISKFQHLRDAGLITSAQAHREGHCLILARRLRERVPDANQMLRRRNREVYP